jgi:hypothetical protein
MDKEKAEGILLARHALNDDGTLHNVGWYLAWSGGDDEATLDGIFSADELEAIAWWMRNGKVKK